jgi:hypothetical protein
LSVCPIDKEFNYKSLEAPWTPPTERVPLSTTHCVTKIYICYSYKFISD